MARTDGFAVGTVTRFRLSSHSMAHISTSKTRAIERCCGNCGPVGFPPLSGMLPNGSVPPPHARGVPLVCVTIQPHEVRLRMNERHCWQACIWGEGPYLMRSEHPPLIGCIRNHVPSLERHRLGQVCYCDERDTLQIPWKPHRWSLVEEGTLQDGRFFRTFRAYSKSMDLYPRLTNSICVDYGMRERGTPTPSVPAVPFSSCVVRESYPEICLTFCLP